MIIYGASVSVFFFFFSQHNGYQCPSPPPVQHTCCQQSQLWRWQDEERKDQCTALQQTT